jgi:Prokaryotic homologs of the JAB domain
MMKEQESGGVRPRPPGPYRLVSERLRVPRRALELTLELFRHSGRLETCCFWYGSRVETVGSVTAVVVPRQQQTWGNYYVTVDAMQRIHQRVGQRGLKNLAQVHSHPSAIVEHSVYDDEMANSRRALSIVVPSYGHWAAAWPSGIGVHEFQNEYWHRLSDRDAAARVELTESSEVEYVDCR